MIKRLIWTIWTSKRPINLISLSLSLCHVDAGGLPNGRDMTCLIVSVWLLPCWCVAGIRQETWHFYLEGCQMAEIWRVILSVYECWHVDVWLESDRRPDISTWRAEEWRALLLNVDGWDYNMVDETCILIMAVLCGRNTVDFHISYPSLMLCLQW